MTQHRSRLPTISTVLTRKLSKPEQDIVAILQRPGLTGQHHVVQREQLAEIGMNQRPTGQRRSGRRQQIVQPERILEFRHE